MKHLICLVMFLFTVNSGIMAQKGFEVNKEITVNVSADKLWQMVGPGFENVHVWASSVDHAEGSGMAKFEGATCSERSCKLNVKGFNKISETLTNYDAKKMTLTYVVNEGMPTFVTLAQNKWTVIPVDATHSKLVMNAKFELKGLMGSLMKGMMRGKLNKTLDTTLTEAKMYAETGEISEAKAKRIAKLKKKAA